MIDEMYNYREGSLSAVTLPDAGAQCQGFDLRDIPADGGEAHLVQQPVAGFRADL